MIFVDQAAEPVTAPQQTELDHITRGQVVVRKWLGERRPLAERAVRPVLVVMRAVGGHDAFEVAAADDQQPVETLAAQAADPAPGVRPLCSSQ